MQRTEHMTHSVYDGHCISYKGQVCVPCRYIWREQVPGRKWCCAEAEYLLYKIRWGLVLKGPKLLFQGTQCHPCSEQPCRVHVQYNPS